MLEIGRCALIYGCDKETLGLELPNEAYDQMREVLLKTHLEATQILDVPPPPLVINPRSKLACNVIAVTYFKQSQGHLITPPIVFFNPEFICQGLRALTDPDSDNARKIRECFRFNTAHEDRHVQQVLQNPQAVDAQLSPDFYPELSEDERFFARDCEYDADLFAWDYMHKRRVEGGLDLQDHQYGIKMADATLYKVRTLRQALAHGNFDETLKLFAN